MRIVGFLIALIIVIWMVGSLVSLYVDRVRRKNDDPPGDDRDVRRRMREIDDAKQRARGDDIPPW
jgi:hypothetical protein